MRSPPRQGSLERPMRKPPYSKFFEKEIVPGVSINKKDGTAKFDLMLLPPDEAAQARGKDAEMAISLAIIASKDCKPCVELKDILKDFTEQEIEYLEVDGDDPAKVDRAVQVVQEVGWSGGLPSVFLLKDGKVVTELAVSEIVQGEFEEEAQADLTSQPAS